MDKPVTTAMLQALSSSVVYPNQCKVSQGEAFMFTTDLRQAGPRGSPQGHGQLTENSSKSSFGDFGSTTDEGETENGESEQICSSDNDDCSSCSEDMEYSFANKHNLVLQGSMQVSGVPYVHTFSNDSGVFSASKEYESFSNDEDWPARYTRFRKSSELIGASTLAIDNKIEQAMDLVKSHLMYAVREEVEVLREQIRELLDKNNQLERENSILRQNATPEALVKVQQARQQQQVSGQQPQQPGGAQAQQQQQVPVTSS